MTYNDKKLRALGYTPAEPQSPTWEIVYERKHGMKDRIKISPKFGVISESGNDENNMGVTGLTCKELMAVAELMESLGVLK